MASNEYGSSDTGSTVSSEVSLTPNGGLNRTTRRRPNARPANFRVNLYNSSSVTIGPKSRIIYSGATQPRGSECGSLFNAESSQSFFTSTETSPLEENTLYDKVPEEVKIHVVENIPNSYCVKSVDVLQHVERDEKWNPRPSKGIIVNEEPEDYQCPIDTFFENPDQFIQEMDKCGDLCKEQRETFILLKVLPHLEEKWGKCSSSNEEIYKNLAKISCSVNSGTVVKHALQLLLRLICKDNLGRGNCNLRVVEAILRSSIFSPKGNFRKDEHSEGQLKLLVYSRILTLLFIQQLQQDQSPLLGVEQELKEMKKTVKACSDQINYKKKDIFRYSMECIVKIIPYLLQPHGKSKLKGLITEHQDFCGDPQMRIEGLTILRTLKKKLTGEWVDLHCILIYLQGKIHSDSPVAQMESELQAIKLFRLIVEACLQGGDGSDWKFCLIASSILVDIANSNILTKEMRNEADSCLENLLKDAKVQKRPECRAILVQQCYQLVFCQDVQTRKLVADFLFNDLGALDLLPAALHTRHLSSMYRTQILEINENSGCIAPACFVNHGMFHRQKVAIKVLHVKKRHLLEDDATFQARQRLIREVYNMGRLNASRHPNFPVLLSYDTESLPYHLITAFERWGNLLQLVRLSREREHPYLTPAHLINMLVDISHALLFLEQLGFVHRAVMAANVLVGSNFVCKLSGLHFMRQLAGGPSDQDADAEEGYCSADQFILEYISTSRDEDPPLRWRAPECLTKNRYSTASDVWAFGVLMYEVFTLGGVPYGHLPNDDDVHIHIVDHKEIVPRELCFEDREYDLIKQFCEWRLHHRLSRFAEVTKRLQELLQHKGCDNYLSVSPPLQKQQATYGSSIEFQCAENSCSPSPGNTEHNQSQDPRPATSPDIQEQVLFDLIKKTDEGRTFVWEKSLYDYRHVKGLHDLKNPNLAPVDNSAADDTGSYFWIISPECPHGNLKEYVLNRKCKQDDIVMFLSQVASALHYLHVNHIVHGDLRAEYVNVVAPDKVQVGRLGRSKPLSMSVDDKGTSKSCVKQEIMPHDALRWSAPEVISDGLYTHASDVWAFGILAWELYTSFTRGQDRRELSVPYCGFYKDEILSYMRKKGPLDKPEDCPQWIYIIMHQCWTFSSWKRPSFLAIFDCLTSREPMKSWIMERWKERHKESDCPDLDIRQEEDASHVLGEEEHPSKDLIEKMCLDDFFTEHDYSYLRDGGNEDDENLKTDEDFYSVPYGIRKVLSTLSIHVEKQASKSDSIAENKTSVLDRTSDDVNGHNIHHQTCQLTAHSSTTESDAACSYGELTRFNVKPQNKDPGHCSPHQQDVTIYDKPKPAGGRTSEDCICCREKRLQNECKPDSFDCDIYDDVVVQTESGEHPEKAVELKQCNFGVYDQPVRCCTLELCTRSRQDPKGSSQKKVKREEANTALEPKHVKPENHATAVAHTDLEDEHRSNIESARQNLPQQIAAHEILAKHTDKGRRQNLLQDLLDERCTEFEYYV